MRTATIKITGELLLQLLKLNNFDAAIIDTDINYSNNVISFKLSGWDLRLPDNESFPECKIKYQIVEPTIELL